MRTIVSLCVWLLCSVAAFGHVDYASAHVEVGHAYVEKVHEMAAAVKVLLSLSKDTSALVEAIKKQCV